MKVSNHAPTDGACKGYPVQWWFPVLSNHISVAVRKETKENIQNAKTLCLMCEKKIQCLTYSLSWEQYGIWGGLTENEREVMRREQGIKMERLGTFDIIGGVRGPSSH